MKVTVEELTRYQKEQVRPLEQEAIRLKASLNRLEREIDRLVRGVGQGLYRSNALRTKCAGSSKNSIA